MPKMKYVAIHLSQIELDVVISCLERDEMCKRKRLAAKHRALNQCYDAFHNIPKVREVKQTAPQTWTVTME